MKISQKHFDSVFVCARADIRYRTPLEALQGYKGAARIALKAAKSLKPSKQRKRLIKDIKRDIKAAEIVEVALHLNR